MKTLLEGKFKFNIAMFTIEIILLLALGITTMFLNASYFSGYSLYLTGSIAFCVVPFLIIMGVYYDSYCKNVSLQITNDEIIFKGTKDKQNFTIKIAEITRMKIGIECFYFYVNKKKYKLNYLTNGGEIKNAIEAIQSGTYKAPTSIIESENGANIPDLLLKYKKLCDEGIITKQEFEAKKKDLLSKKYD